MVEMRRTRRTTKTSKSPNEERTAGKGAMGGPRRSSADCAGCRGRLARQCFSGATTGSKLPAGPFLDTLQESDDELRARQPDRQLQSRTENPLVAPLPGLNPNGLRSCRFTLRAR